MSIKKIIKLHFLLLVLISGDLRAADFAITVSNNTAEPLYISAFQFEFPWNKIKISPDQILSKEINKKVFFSKIKKSSESFEIYFGKYRDDHNCVFVYEISRNAVFPVECPDLRHAENSGRSITFNE